MIVWSKSFKGCKKQAYNRLELARKRYFQHFLDSEGSKTNAGYQLTIRSWRDKYKGERCFILGNGPSLKKMDLSFLKNEFTIGSNGIYKNFKYWGWHTDYLLFEDTEQTELRGPDLPHIKGPVKMAAIYNAYAFEADNDTYFFNARRADQYYWQKLHPMFSRQFDQIVFLGSTVTYIALQLAYHLGFKEVYLIGVDHNYGKLPELFPPGKIEITKENYHLVQQCHFDKNYYKIGDLIGVPHVKLQEEAYEKAKLTFLEDGRKILNAGVDSKLKIYKQVNYKNLFPKKSTSIKSNNEDFSQSEHDIISSKIKDITLHEKNYAIYGAGKFTRSLLAKLRNSQLPLPSFIFDDSPNTNELESIPVFESSKIKDKEVKNIILGSDTFQKEMKRKLTKLSPESNIFDLFEIQPSRPISKNGKNVLFISHASNLSGAPISLRMLITYFLKKTNWNIRVLVRRNNGSLSAFQELCPCDFAFHPGQSEFERKKSIDELRVKYRSWKPDFIYSNTSLNGDLINLLNLENVPTCVHVRELEQTFNLLSSEQLISFLNQPSYYFAVSNAVKSYLILKHNIPENKINIAQVSVDLNEIYTKGSQSKTPSKWDVDTFVIGGVGSLSNRKGTDLFLNVAKEVHQSHPMVKFSWLGGGKDHNIYLELAKKLDIAHIVEFCSETKNPYPFFSKISMLLMTSRDDPFPRVNLEAGAFSKPIICFSDSGGSSEFASNNCGLSIHNGFSTKDMALKCIELIENPKLLKFLGNNAIKKVKECYQLDRIGKLVLETLKREFPKIF